MTATRSGRQHGDGEDDVRDDSRSDDDDRGDIDEGGGQLKTF